MTTSSSLLELLRCPRCTPPAPLALGKSGDELCCVSGQHTYPFTVGFPDLRPENLKAPAPAAPGK